MRLAIRPLGDNPLADINQFDRNPLEIAIGESHAPELNLRSRRFGGLASVSLPIPVEEGASVDVERAALLTVNNSLDPSGLYVAVATRLPDPARAAGVPDS